MMHRMIILAVAVFTLAASTTIAQDTKSDVVPQITVTGTAEMVVVPDRATISLGIQSRNKDVRKAQQEVTTTMRGIVKALTDLGVDKKNIRTTNVSVQPQYQYKDGRSYPDGFLCASSVRVKLTDLEIISDVISRSIEAGANDVESLQFERSDITAIKDSVLVLAMRNAREKASRIAAEAGVSVGMPLSISDNTAQWAPSPFQVRGSRMTKSDVVVDGLEVSEQFVAVGEQTVKSTINATFELTKK
jgi:uncharacterized protein YggE